MSSVSSVSQTLASQELFRPIDPRGPRVGATITTVVLALVLLGGGTGPALLLLAAQTLVFALGATRGPGASPYAWVFRRLVRPRLAPPTELEDSRPPRFAQTVGLGFAVVALLGFAAGLGVVGLVATGFALAAALLNAVFGFCLGCEIHLLLQRATAR